MKWILLITTAINGEGIEIARYDAYEQCTKAETVIDMFQRSVAESSGKGFEEAPAIYGQCWREDDPRIPKGSVLEGKVRRQG